MLTSRTFALRALLVLLAVVIAFTTSTALAQSYDASQDLRKPTLTEKRLNKLGRGLANVLFGWAEIPVTFDKKLKEGKPLTYLLTTAPVIGTVKAAMRTGVGIYEVFTFARENPRDLNYEAILEPEYIF